MNPSSESQRPTSLHAGSASRPDAGGADGNSDGDGMGPRGGVEARAHANAGTGTPAGSGASGIAFGLAATLCWSAFVLATAAGLQGDQPPFDVADLLAIRFGVAGLVFLPFLWLRRAEVAAAGLGWGRALALALVAGPVFSLLNTGGYAFAPLTHGAVVQPASVTIATLLVGVALLGERLNARKVFGVLIIVAGLVLVAGAAESNGGGHVAPQPLLGDALFVGSGLAWAVYTLLLRRWQTAPIVATIVVCVVSMLLVLPPYFLFHGAAHLWAHPREALIQALCQGLLAGAGATFAYSSAVARLGAGRAGVFLALVPAAALLLGMPFLGVVPHAVQWAGLVLASLGLVLVSMH